MLTLGIILIVAGTLAGYLVGWSRGTRGLARWPVSIGKGGIHTGPSIVLLLGLAVGVSCTERKSSQQQPVDTTARRSAPDTAPPPPRQPEPKHGQQQRHKGEQHGQHQDQDPEETR